MKRIIRLTERDLTRIVRRVIKENEDDDDGIDFNFDFGGPKDSTALISDIVELIENSEDVNDFKMKIKKYTKNNQEDFNKLSLLKRDEIDRFINSIMTRHNFDTGEDDQTSEYTSYGKPSKYDPQYSQDPFERYDHGGSQSGH